MKRFQHKLIGILLVILSSNIQGQNLVPNPSFEDTVNCPTLDDQVYNALGWSNYSDQSPDYFNSCTSNSDIDIPNNWGGYQPAASGNAYCAVSAFFPNTPNKREVIGRDLLSSLQIGTKYFVSMKVNLSISTNASSSYACNKLGIRFSTVPYSFSTPAPINNDSHVWTNSVITDTLNWTTIFGSFVADSSYGYLSIGNFFDDNNTDTTKILGGTPPFIFAYYYVDDICVSTDSSFAFNYVYTGIEEEQTQDNFSVYPNPVENYIYLTNKSYSSFDVTIYNAIGQVLFQEQDVISKSKNIDATHFASGMLLINIQSKNESFTYKLLKP